ncbi:MAG: hypothetical protein QXK37_05945, partial [Candidatus Woesearchaeota archaeon]
EGVYVTSTGNVGIGTNAPAQRLDVNGQIHSTGDICTDSGGGKCLSTGTSAKIENFYWGETLGTNIGTSETTITTKSFTFSTNQKAFVNSYVKCRQNVPNGETASVSVSMTIDGVVCGNGATFLSSQEDSHRFTLGLQCITPLLTGGVPHTIALIGDANVVACLNTEYSIVILGLGN